MTDHPRFQLTGPEVNQQHRQYHGAPQVELLFRLVDWWLDRRWRVSSDERPSIQSAWRSAGAFADCAPRPDCQRAP
jgi:hypothetical protein